VGPLIECVPNFSEGRDASTLGALEDAIRADPAVMLLDVHADPFHNRAVFTFVAPPLAASAAAFRAMAVALARIDLTRHRGEHPRIGATDVVPFVPWRDVPVPELVRLARELGARAGRELALPVYFYGDAATRPERERLPAIRAGGFEGLRERIARDPAALPDAGPAHLHPTAGATAIGVRRPLVAFNVFLTTADVSVAQAIARRIRTSGGGLPAVQAAGFDVAGRAQVSMNLLDIDRTTPATAFRAVAREAARRGVDIERSEIVGLAPERAFADTDPAELRLPDATQHLLEPKIRAAERRG